MSPACNLRHRVWVPAFAGTTVAMRHDVHVKRAGRADGEYGALGLLPQSQRKTSYPASTASAPVTASALSVTVFSSDGACTEMFSAKKRASAT